MKNFKLLTFITLLFIAFRCEEYTEGINDDPNAFTVASSDLLIGQVQLSYMQHMVVTMPDIHLFSQINLPVETDNI